MSSARKLSPGISVVIPTIGQRVELLARSVAALLRDPATHEVIVVVSGGAAADLQLFEREFARRERIRLLVPPRAGGNAVHGSRVARDIGVREAKADVVLALDDDVEPLAGLASGHARRHAETGDLLVLGYMPVVGFDPASGGSEAAARLYSDSYEAACIRYRTDPDTVLTGLWAGSFSLPRDTWLRAAEAPYVIESGYHSDREFGLRLRAKGCSGVFDPALRARHHYVRSTRELLESAKSSGANQLLLSRAYPELVAPPAPSSRRSAVLLSHLARSETSARAGEVIFIRLAKVAARLRLKSLEYLLVRALWRLGLMGAARVG